ncbi:MAG: FAD-dependent oxidoreductase [Ilumatobacteraceae bacterium]
MTAPASMIAVGWFVEVTRPLLFALRRPVRHPSCQPTHLVPYAGRVRGGTATPSCASDEPLRWAVVGAGVLGMSLALRLARAGHHVTLLEAGEVLGGLASPWELGDVTWDRHYHVTLLSDSRTREMYSSVGIGEDELRWVETRTGYYGPDRTLRSVSNAIEFLQLPGLSLIDKGRLGATIVVGSKIRNGRKMERVTVERWLRRWSGNSAFETFWKPLLRAKLGDAYPKASAAFIWATIQRLYAARRSGLKKEMFGYAAGGYAFVCERFAVALADAGVEVRLGTPVRSLEQVDGALSVEPIGGQRDTFDRVVVTTSASRAATMCPGLLPGERERLQRVEYLGIVCVSLLLDRPLAPYYLTYITDPATPFTAVVEMTSFIDPAEVGGKSLVYLPKYTSTDDPLFAATDDDVVAAFTPYLRQMYPDLLPEQILIARVSKVAQVFAVPSLGFSDDAPSIGTSVPGLFLAGSAHLPFSTLNVNDTLSLVDEVLREAGVEPPATVTKTSTGEDPA